MRIGITCHHTYGGSGTVATELGMSLAKRGHEVRFICFDRPYRLQDHPNISFDPVEVMHYPLFENTPTSLSLAVKMREVVCNHELDLLHVHYAIPFATSAYLARQMCSRFRIPFVTTLHGTDITLVGQHPSYFVMTRFSIEQSTAITAVSNWLKQETLDKFDIDRPIQVIYNSVDLDRFQRREADCCARRRYAPNDEPILMHISNFRPVKRVQDVVRAFARVRAQMPARLLMIGDGPERDPAQKLARELGVADDVFFPGKQQQVEAFLSIADLYFLPSESESFGLSALEANACGVPVIGSNAGGLPEVIIEGETGFLCPVGDVDCMADRALMLLRNRDRRLSMAEAGARRAREEFGATRIVEQYEELYAGIIAGDVGL